MMYDDNTEKALLGSILIDGKLFANIIGFTQDYFGDIKHKAIFYVMEKMYTLDMEIDPVTFAEYCKNVNVENFDKSLSKHVTTMLDVCGGFDYIRKIFEESSKLLNGEAYASIVENYYKKRMLTEQMTSVLNKSGDYLDMVNDIIEIYSNASKMISGETDKTSIREAMDNVIQNVEAVLYQGKKISVVKTGLSYIDNSVDFFKRKSIYGIGGAAGAGKSALIIHMIDSICLYNQINNYDYGILLVTGEDDREGVARRIFASKTGISDLAILEGKLSKDNLSKLHYVMDCISGYRFWVENSAMFTTSQLKTWARHYNVKHGLSTMFVDHFNCIEVTERTNSDLARAQKKTSCVNDIAEHEDIALFTALHQKEIQGNPSNRDSWRPRYSNLQDYGAYKQKAAGFVLINRDWLYTHADNDMYSAQLYFEKMRHGNMQMQEIEFDWRYSRITKKGGSL